MLTLVPTATRSPLFHCFATLLGYPSPELAEAARNGEALLSAEHPDAAAQLHRFRETVERLPLGRMEEIYTGAFDLTSSSFPYVGYHLFGESYKRSVFLLGLKERYQAHGYSIGVELPDHLAVLLGFAAITDDADLIRDLVEEAVLPVLPRLLGEGPAPDAASEDDLPPEPSDSIEVYRHVLRALRLTLQALGFTARSELADVPAGPDQGGCGNV
ncbi:MAG: nitrate reductase molybdenum cofactor assembly chaperone [Chloroflexi bacterium]|nr:nitrate reductase molybdenum cofactor assembly chaperone [Chloroflexota bacterium]